MSEETSRTEPFAHILIVDSDKDLRESALNKISVPNCAVDVAMDEDEAVHKAQQHRPQLIIIERHEPLDVNLCAPLRTSAASSICRRAHLTRATRLVTHSDIAITFHGTVTIACSNPQLPILVRPEFTGQDWRKEWYLYCGPDSIIKYLSHHIPYLLGRRLIHNLGGLQKYGNVLLIKPPYLLRQHLA
jgi:CheY-like chemotaxis protein